MNMNTITRLIIFVVVGVILSMGVLVPLIDGMSTYTKTVNNDAGVIRYTETDSFEADLRTLNEENLSSFPSTWGYLMIFTSDFIAISYSSGGVWGQWTGLGVDEVTGINYNINDCVVSVDNLEYTMSAQDGTQIHTGTLDFAFIPDGNGDFYRIGTNYGVVADNSISIYTVSKGGSNFGVTHGTLSTQITDFKVTSSVIVDDYTAELTYNPNEGEESSNVYGVTSDGLQEVIIPIDAVFRADYDTVVFKLVYLIPVFVLIGVIVAMIKFRD